MKTFSYMDESYAERMSEIYRDIVKPWLIFLAGVGLGIVICGGMA